MEHLLDRGGLHRLWPALRNVPAATLSLAAFACASATTLSLAAFACASATTRMLQLRPRRRRGAAAERHAGHIRSHYGHHVVFGR